MRHLQKFFNYITESQDDVVDLSKDELDELLLPVKDLGIEYSITEPRTITSGEYSGFKSMNINFKNSFQLGEAGGYTEQIIDPKFWDFLEEIISLKNRLGSSRVSINTNWRHHIVVTFIQKTKVEGDLFLTQQLYNEMSKRTNASKSDFSNCMTKRLYKEELKIVITCNGFDDSSSYTDRKWNGLFRGIDFSKFNVEKEISRTEWGNTTAVVTITLNK